MSEITEPCEPAGHVRLRLSGSVKSDCWSDYTAHWSSDEQTRFDAANPSHFGWVVGLHLGDLGESLVTSRTCDEAEAMGGLADAFQEMADVIRRKVAEFKATKEMLSAR